MASVSARSTACSVNFLLLSFVAVLEIVRRGVDGSVYDFDIEPLRGRFRTGSLPLETSDLDSWSLDSLQTGFLRLDCLQFGHFWVSPRQFSHRPQCSQMTHCGHFSQGVVDGTQWYSELGSNVRDALGLVMNKRRCGSCGGWGGEHESQSEGVIALWGGHPMAKEGLWVRLTWTSLQSLKRIVTLQEETVLSAVGSGESCSCYFHPRRWSVAPYQQQLDRC